MSRTIVIGTRGSDLALWQAHHVKRTLEAAGKTVRIEVIKTRGDKIQHLSFDKMEGKGFFTKEIEEALLSEAVDLAVHSHKDLETRPPEGLVIGAVSEREDPTDWLLIRKESAEPGKTMSLKEGAVVGTSSARRKAMLLDLVPHIELKDLRGNVPTRIRKLAEGQYDAILLAAAGVKRLEIDLSEFHVEALNPTEFVPAPAQGVLALQVRDTDTELKAVLAGLSNDQVQTCIGIEREVLRMMDGGCQLPLGVYCEQKGTTYQVHAAMAKTWDGTLKRVVMSGENAEALPQAILSALNE